jgi:hypothetical protein
MSERVGIRFEIGDLFPSDDPVARWITPCAMALNDLLYVHRHLYPLLTNDGPGSETMYLSRLAAAHLFEIATFLSKSDRRVPEVRSFVAKLDEDAREAYEALTAIRPGGDEPFAGQLKHARNHVFHYAKLLPSAVEHENLKKAMDAHADTVSEIRDESPPIEGFRSLFADDIATELSVPGDVDFHTYVPALATAMSRYLTFAKAALNQYIREAPPDHWSPIEADDGSA